ncbi:unnamed protein product [marine sediment metagenome]|uniref:Uncharacterized protein n=1 Tax=marine sediment metagenome TaxID=412755 RepID=X1QMZ3_9ZZZZ
MSHLSGRMMVVELDIVSVGAGTTVVPIRPQVRGIEWEIIWAIGKQDDGAVVHGWQWLDPENPAGVSLYGVLGDANVALPLGALDSDLPNVSMGPWWATWDRYPQYYFEASAVGKTGKIIAIIIESAGYEDLQ